jgi:hypothetical protein
MKTYYRRFYENTKYEGWEIYILGLFIKWNKFPNHPHYSYWRGNNFGSIIIWNRRLEFSLPKLHNN